MPKQLLGLLPVQNRKQGYGIAIVRADTHETMATLWRSDYQSNAQFIEAIHATWPDENHPPIHSGR